MNISDLNHLEVVSNNQEVVGGYYGYGDYSFISDTNKDFNIDIYTDVDQYTYLSSYGFAYNNTATAEGEAVAFGDNTNAQAYSFTYTDDWTSQAGATSSSTTGSLYYY
ncbi:MAG: hypothetical protein RIM23_18230 [Coleofasciculus sp. G3-WIS-01]|uniref:hypothetical protein n=1 Tax=Coleofasciculus sp. G3-WIS-01 TaxID=3069528 RepID=UPI0033023C08